MSETMRLEIRRQPALVSEILPLLREAVKGLDLRGSRMVAAGCGDGFFAAGAGSAFFASAGMEYLPATAHDLAFHITVRESDLVVLLSISGSTRRTVQAAWMARSKGANTLAITCNRKSRLAAECAQVLELPFQPLSRKTPHTADYVATLVALAVLAERCRGQPDESLDRLPDVIEGTLATSEKIASVSARSLDPSTKLFFLGQGSNLYTAQYIAAKFHESGGLVALAFETENFVHGANFMVEPTDLVCVIGDGSPGAFRALELMPGLTRLCDHVLLIGNDDIPCGNLVKLTYPAVPSTATVFPSAVAGQVLCYAIAEAFGLAVEEPRAGRERGSLHAEVQHAWMTQTATTIPE